VVAIALFAAACGGGAEETSTTTAPVSAESSTTIVTDTTTTTGPSGAVSGLKGVRGAVVRIVSEGTFVEPDQGASTVTGTGSGFIIDPSGLAVTNNHVVTGAAFLQVYLEGEEEAMSAKVLGLSECSDLAVIDIDGVDLPYLDWYEGDITVGLDVFAAGFPLGDPEYTLTEGIVSKEKADGDTSWASVDSVIQHTARILPGNSGGPLVTPDGQVVGVINYSGVTELDINHAISRDEALKILNDLVAGNDVNSIGVNGTAGSNEVISGIWVSAVESGSPAANTGVNGGDIITELEGLVLATDGTMADYCNILESHGADDPLAIEILRTETGEVLQGTLNGDQELTLAFSFAEELGDDVGGAAGVAYEYVEVYDDDGVLVMQIPTTWADIDGSGWNLNDEIVGPGVIAAPSISTYYDSWTTPGVFFGASTDLLDEMEPGDLLNVVDLSDSCTYDDTYDYADAVYTGAYDVWLNCGGTDAAFLVLEAYPQEQDFVVFIQIQVVTDADLEALDVILATFDVLAE